jgi:hypothetical protein
MKPVKYMLLCFSDIMFSAFEIPKLRVSFPPALFSEHLFINIGVKYVQSSV